MTASSSPQHGQTVENRFLALTLPRLPTDRIMRERVGRGWRSEAQGGRGATEGGAPPLLALYRNAANANRITAVCEQAEEAGLVPGLGLAEARARFPSCETLACDPEADRRLLAAIADWCDRYTPLVALDPPFGLVLDISGCAHLQGGERALMDDILIRLFHQGFAASAAIASSAGAAMALMTAGAAPLIVPRGGERAAVAPLSVKALRLEPEMAALLARLGLKTVAVLLDQPRAGLARRFGKTLLDRLDAATGIAERPINPRRPVAHLSAERRLFEPISLMEDIARLLLSLAERLKGDLEERGLGARRLELSLFRVDGVVSRLEVGTARPLREPKRVAALFREKLASLGDELDAGFGYDLVRLSVHEAESLEGTQTDLTGEDPEGTGLTHLVDRLGARLGQEAVLLAETVESWIPERAAHWRPAATALAERSRPAATALAEKARPAAVALAERVRPAASALGDRSRLAASPVAGRSRLVAGKATSSIDARPAPALRPLRLLAQPEPIEASFDLPDGAPFSFRWRRALYRVRRAEGPERIAGEWWREDPEAPRDYFRVEDETGRHFWLFREHRRLPGDRNRLDPDLVLPGHPAVWFMHGLFA